MYEIKHKFKAGRAETRRISSHWLFSLMPCRTTTKEKFTMKQKESGPYRGSNLLRVSLDSMSLEYDCLDLRGASRKLEYSGFTLSLLDVSFCFSAPIGETLRLTRIIPLVSS